MNKINVGTAVKVFNYEQEITQRGFYRITVKSNGRKIKVFSSPTVYGVQRAFERAGFQPIAWAEGPKIVLKDVTQETICPTDGEVIVVRR